MRKNVIKISAIALLSAFALTACNDEIIAKPTGYDENSPIVNINGDSDIYNNNFTDVYKSIRSGSIPADVLDQLLYQYSISVFGNYNKITAKKISNNSFGETTLKQAVHGLQHDASGDLTGGDEIAKKFINDHSAYWTKNNKGERVRAEGQADDDVTLAEFARLEEKWNTIEKRIAQKMYSLISGGSYSEENVFDEAKFVRSLASSIENNVIATPTNTFKGVLTAQVEDYDVFKEKSTDIEGNEDFILHRDNYQSAYDPDVDENPDTVDATYVEDKVLPDIYRQLLVEQYILDKSYDTLGRTSARHISVLSISNNSKYDKGANDLMHTYVYDYIFSNPAAPKTIDLKSFKMGSNAWIGTFMSDTTNYTSTEEYKLMNKAVPDYFVGGAKPYFKGTAYGDMMEEIEKIADDPKISENEGSYTGSNSYTVEVGKEIKTRELELKDYTSTGWYVKSVGVSDLPDNIKNQLFDINVANALLGEACVEYSYDTTANEWKTNEVAGSKNLVNVVGKINNQYFLRKTSRVADEKVQNDILFKSDNTYYLVLVEDAIKSKVLNKATYADLEGSELTDAMNKLENYINEIVQLVAGNDTYQTLSKKHWVEKMEIKYHDTKVYDYFKSTFPELFD